MIVMMLLMRIMPNLRVDTVSEALNVEGETAIIRAVLELPD